MPNQTESNNPVAMAAAIEALLFMAGEPMDQKTLVKLLDTDDTEVSAGLDNLEQRLMREEYALSLLRAPEGVQLVTKPVHAVLIERFLRSGTREQLTPAAAETLAIVAYRGPIHRAGVEAIRGVNSTFSLRLLMLRGLIDRYPSEKDSRIFLYRVNADFLRHLGLNKADDLPDYQKFRQHDGMTNLEKSAETAYDKLNVIQEKNDR